MILAFIVGAIFGAVGFLMFAIVIAGDDDDR